MKNKIITGLAEVPLLMMTAKDEYEGVDKYIIRATKGKLGTASPREAYKNMLSPTWADVGIWLKTKDVVDKALKSTPDEETYLTPEECVELIIKGKKKLIKRHKKTLDENFDKPRFNFWKKTLIGPGDKRLSIMTITSDCDPYETVFCRRFTVIRYLMNLKCIYLGERLESNDWLPDGSWINKIMESGCDLGRIIKDKDRPDMKNFHRHVIGSCRNLPNFTYRHLMPKDGEY